MHDEDFDTSPQWFGLSLELLQDLKCVQGIDEFEFVYEYAQFYFSELI
jgi:hypothetical protein